MKGVLVRLIVIAFLLCAVAAADGERCGRDFHGKECSDYSCCSRFGWCGISEAYCSKQEGCQSYCWNSDGGGDNETAYSKDFKEEEHNWNLTEAHVTCAEVDDFANKPLWWRKKFRWAAFRSEANCGKCVRVVNTKKDKGEDVHAAVRVLDSSADDFLLDSKVYDHLNFDNSSVGHIYVNYHFIDCEDDDSALLSIV